VSRRRVPREIADLEVKLAEIRERDEGAYQALRLLAATLVGKQQPKPRASSMRSAERLEILAQFVEGLGRFMGDDGMGRAGKSLLPDYADEIRSIAAKLSRT
jgi:hypothetical protein